MAVFLFPMGKMTEKRGRKPSHMDEFFQKFLKIKKNLTLIFFCGTVNNALLCRSIPRRDKYAQKWENQFDILYIERTGVKRQWRKTEYVQ